MFLAAIGIVWLAIGTATAFTLGPIIGAAARRAEALDSRPGRGGSVPGGTDTRRLALVPPVTSPAAGPTRRRPSQVAAELRGLGLIVGLLAAVLLVLLGGEHLAALASGAVTP